jgi:hypothetical protein
VRFAKATTIMWMRIIIYMIALAALSKARIESQTYLGCGRIMDMKNNQFKHIIDILINKHGWLRIPLIEKQEVKINGEIKYNAYSFPRELHIQSNSGSPRKQG